MIYVHSELELIDIIQQKALERASMFEKEVIDKQPFSPQAGREIVERFLWKGGKTADVDGETSTSESTIYGLLADGIKTAITNWKKDRHQSLPTIISTWISYNSKLYNLDWVKPERVLATDSNGSYVNYHWHASQSEKLLTGTGPVELWFSVLGIDISPEPEPESFPTIHNYLSEYKPSFKINETDSTPVSAVTFYTRDSGDSSYSKIIDEEMEIITRKDSEEHQYIEMTLSPDKAKEKEEIEAQQTVRNPVATSRLKSQEIESLASNLSILIDGTKIDLKDPHPENELPFFSRPTIRTNWSHRYAFLLRNVIMRTEYDWQRAEPPLQNQLEPRADVKEASNIIFNKEKEMIRNSDSAIDWGKVFYKCMTNIRVSVPESDLTDLGSIVVFSDRVIGPRLTKIIASAVWPIFSHLRQVETSLISAENLRKHALRSAIAAIMGRNMSHNIGSHVLAYLSSEDSEANLWVTS